MISLILAAASLSLGAAGCPLSFPKVERCINGDSGCICHDPRKPEGERDYIRPYGKSYSEGGCLNNISTNPEDYHTMNKWISRSCR